MPESAGRESEALLPSVAQGSKGCTQRDLVQRVAVVVGKGECHLPSLVGGQLHGRTIFLRFLERMEEELLDPNAVQGFLVVLGRIGTKQISKVDRRGEVNPM